MQSHPTVRTLRLWLLAWFVMALAAAAASPLIAPRALELVCSGTGGTRLVVKTAEGLAAADSAGLDCPLCLAADAPPASPITANTTAAAPPLALLFHTSLSDRTGMALSPPARAPPLFN